MVAVHKTPPRLHVDHFGEGPPLVMLHGWAMHSGLWSGLAAELAGAYSVYLVDLPGHGYSAVPDDVNNLDEFAERINETLAQYIDEPFHLVGWSLGGLIALYWLLADPERIRKLQLIAANPCFVQRDDWPCGVNAHVLKTFAAQLSEHYEKTLQRFLALQLKGDPQAREHLRTLREHLFERGVPATSALHAGLDVLLNTDLRDQLARLKTPVQLILGERDTLVPASLAERIVDYSPLIDVQLIRGAGHAPFLSHQRKVMEYTKQFFE